MDSLHLKMDSFIGTLEERGDRGGRASTSSASGSRIRLAGEIPKINLSASQGGVTDKDSHPRASSSSRSVKSFHNSLYQSSERGFTRKRRVNDKDSHPRASSSSRPVKSHNSLNQSGERGFTNKDSHPRASSSTRPVKSFHDSLNQEEKERFRSKKTVRPSYTKFGFKRMQELVNKRDCNEVVTYICQNKDTFDSLLKEQPRTDLLHLIMEMIVLTVDTEFKDSKSTVYSTVCVKEFVEYLIIHLTKIAVERDVKKILSNVQFLKNLCLFLGDLIIFLPTKAMESADSLLLTLHMVVTRQPEYAEMSETVSKIQDDFQLAREKWETKEKTKENLRKREYEERPPPDDFREISIYPTSDDLKDKNFLRKNIVDGSYENVHHYLDVQFRLLREDFIGPLRDGITDYKQSLISPQERSKRNFNIRIYRDVRVSGIAYDSKKLGDLSLVVSLEKKFAARIKWEYSKRLLFGSLCILTSNDFETFQLVTVADRKIPDLQKGIVNVTLIGENVFGNELFTKKYTMAESSAFFEPVYQVLTAIQLLPTDKLPMEKYLLVKDIGPSQPQYLRGRTQIEINRRLVSINDDLLWPPCESLGFNESQCAALKAALRNEFVVVQGPPGTGKTYFGLNLVKILLKNVDFSSPILMVCYTNHALDQFLEGLTSVTDSIVRIGGQSKNEALNKFNFTNLKRGNRVSRSESFYEVKDSMVSTLKKLASFDKLLNGIERCFGILNIVEYRDVLNKEVSVFENCSDFLSWILCDSYDLLCFLLKTYLSKQTNEMNQPHMNHEDSNVYESDDEDNVRRKNYFEDEDTEDLLQGDIIGQVKYSLTAETLQRIMQSMEQVLLNLNTIDAPDSTKKIVMDDFTLAQNLMETVNRNLNTPFIKQSKEIKVLLKKNIWVLSPNDRWALYHYWVQQIQRSVTQDMDNVRRNYSNLLNRWREMRVVDDYSVIKEIKPKILGLTTTGAARHHMLLSALKPAVIVVEEAAEVLEAHVVVSLTKSCQHLILIGDHKQLKPNPSSFRLAKDFNLDVSLFERMIMNGVGCQMLNVQHRMKPNIASLIAPTIYPQLYNHKSTEDFPPVLGISKNLFFVDHQVFEKKDQDMESHNNPHEAQFMIALCRHLILQGYDPSDITILTTYSSQQFYLRELKKQKCTLKEVRMTVVDNYQGEENKIILLSLVRSNEEGKIGFLKTENRICVALSRAKHGLYIIGNMAQLKSNSDIWVKINDTLERNEAIGSALPLVCQIHETVTRVACGEDFDGISEGGCRLPCLRMMPCGHYCKSLCHVVNVDHSQTKCTEPCAREICNEFGHSCPLKCYQACQPCGVIVNRTLPKCGHSVDVPCYIDTNDPTYRCIVVVKDTKLDCNHEVERCCFLDVMKVRCTTKCDIRLDCGHMCSLSCHVNKDPEHLDYKCMKDCSEKNAQCKEAHPCKKRCYEECGLCTFKVQRTISCGHTVKMDCSMDPDEYKCNRDCTRTMACGHKCRRKCCDPCVGCDILVEKPVPGCGHTLKVRCDQTVTPNMCKSACKRTLACGHPCKLKCNQTCSECKCQEYVPSLVVPACGHPGTVICSKAGEMTDPCSDQLLRYCREPCRKELPCGDICSGTCGSCMQGRIHQVCWEKCGNVLICGHQCEVPCREVCPPCKMKCQYRCQHSKCGKSCGVPCTPCTEKCTWACRHLKCTKLCGEPCDRIPCYEPCDKQLKCGHPCVGFCGEPCPPLCRICNNKKLTEIFFGSEDEEDSRFVLLEDCQHTLESTGLEQYLSSQSETNSREICVIRCPICSTPITRTLRFSNAKQSFINVQQVKKRIFGGMPEIKALHRRLVSQSLPNIYSLIEKCPDFVKSCKSLLDIMSAVERIRFKSPNTRRQQYKFGITELNLFNFFCCYLQDLLGSCTLLNGLHKKQKSIPFLNDLYLKIRTRFYLIMYHLSKRIDKISLTEIEQFHLELFRFKRIVHFFEALHKVTEEINLSRVSDKITAITKRLFSIEPYNDDHDKLVVEEIKKLSDIIDFYHKPVSPEEMKMIHRAMMTSFSSPYKQGHWYKCSNGHIYTITECGGAMETSKCPECRETIGGTNHTLVRSSRVASEMDGARHPAWSDRNNMLNYEIH